MTERLADVIKYRQIPACFIILYATYKSYGKNTFLLKNIPLHFKSKDNCKFWVTENQTAL